MNLLYRTAWITIVFFAMTLSSDAAQHRETTSRNLGSELGCARILEPAQGWPRAALVCLHGMQSNRDWWLPIGRELAGRGIVVWAFDRPGSGNPPPPGPATVTTRDRYEWANHMDIVNAAVRQRYGEVPVFAAGVSWGASPALLASEGKGDDKRGAVWAGAILLNPAFKTTRDSEFKRRFWFHFLPWNWFGAIQIPIRADDYTTRAKTKDKYLRDCQLKHTVTAGFLVRTNKVKKEAIQTLKHPEELRHPALVLIGGTDTLAPESAFKETIGSAHEETGLRTVHSVPNASHAAILEPERRKIAGRIEHWVGRQIAKR